MVKVKTNEKAEKVAKSAKSGAATESRNPTDWATAKGFTQIVIWGPKQLNEDLKTIGAAVGMSKAEYARTVLAAAVEGTRKTLKAARAEAKSTPTAKAAAKPTKPASAKKASSVAPAAVQKPKTQKPRRTARGADVPPETVQDTHNAEIVQSAPGSGELEAELAA